MTRGLFTPLTHAKFCKLMWELFFDKYEWVNEQWGPVAAILGFTYGKHQGRRPLRLFVALPFCFLANWMPPCPTDREKPVWLHLSSLVICFTLVLKYVYAADHRNTTWLWFEFHLAVAGLCGSNWTRASKHQSDSQLIFFLRTRRTIRSSNLIIFGGLVRA